MENNEKERLKPELTADDSDQELTNKIDGTKAVLESEMMSDDGTDNIEIAHLNDVNRDKRNDEKLNRTQINSKQDTVDLPHDIPNDETPPLSDFPKDYEKMNKKEMLDDSNDKE